MINLPTLVRFQGQVPDRATMNREEFAIATYYYLRYINDDFVPSFEEKSEAIETQLNQFSDDMNTLKSDTEAVKNETEALKDTTQTLKDQTETLHNETATLHDETQSFRDTAGQYKDLAKNYANADQNVEVEQGYYSAKHWAMVAQNLANDTEAVLPEGSINDSAVASTTTWSSQKLDSYLAKSDISNVAASAILEKVKSVDGVGSGLDADLLDGHEGSYYTNASNISSGTLSADRLPTTINSNTTGNAATASKLQTARTIALSGDVSGSASFDGSGNVTITTTVQNNASHNHDDRYYTKSQSDSRYLGKTAKAVDSDKLDGHDSSYFLNIYTSQLKIRDARNDGDITPDNYPDYKVSLIFTDDIPSTPYTWNSVITAKGWGDGYAVWQLIGPSDTTVDNNLYFRSGKGSSWGALQKIWHSGNDGAGSGLDADKLDGYDASHFAVAGHTHDDRYYTKSQSDGRYLNASGDTITGDLYIGYDGNGHSRSIIFHGASSSSTDFAVRAEGEHLVFFEPEDNSKWHFKIIDDGGVDARFGFKWNGQSLDDRYLSKTAKAVDSDKLDGMQPSTSNSANTIARRDGSGDITARLFRTTYGAQTSAPSANAEFFFRNSSSDNYMRPLSAQAFKDWLENVLGVGGMKIKNRFEGYVHGNTSQEFNLGFTPNWDKVFITISGDDVIATSGFMYSEAGDFYFEAKSDSADSVGCVVHKVDNTTIEVWNSSGTSQIVLIEFS